MSESETPQDDGNIAATLRVYASAEVTRGPNWDPSWDDATGKPKE